MSRIIDYYSQFDEWGRLEREPLEFRINWHYMRQFLPESGRVLDNGAGPGKYAMELARHGCQVTLCDLTPRLVEIAGAKADELGLRERFDGFLVRNAVNLEGLPDERFDASLMMGPLYHLQQEDERVRAVQELYRVTKKGGIIFAAFQSTMRMTLNVLQQPQHWKPLERMEPIRTFRSSGVFDHADEGRFTGAYYFDVHEIRPFMESHGFETLELIGSSSIGHLLSREQQQYWEERGESAELLELLVEAAKDPSILGVSSHLLYIGRRK